MKKFLAILAVAGVFAACNSGSDETKTGDSTGTNDTVTVNTTPTTDTVVVKTDSTVKADSASKK